MFHLRAGKFLCISLLPGGKGRSNDRDDVQDEDEGSVLFFSECDREEEKHGEW